MQIAKFKALLKKGSKTELPINLSSTTYVKSLGKSNAWVDHRISWQTQNLAEVLIKTYRNHSTDFCMSYLAEKTIKQM